MLYKNKKINKKITLPIMIALFVAVGFAIYFTSRSDNSQSSNDGKSEEMPINFAPPTVEEQKAGDDKKAEIAKKQASENSSSANSNQNPKTVKPTITYAGQYGDQVEVGAYVGGIFEDGGKCILSLSNGSITKSTTVTSVKGANSVDCPVMAIKRTELTPGKWQATVTYDSTTAKGASDVRAFEVR